MKFKAKDIFADYDENEVLIIGFSAGFLNTEKPIYFMIQDASEYDVQDIRLGMDTYYIEKNDQSMGGYGGIKKLYLSRNRIQIILDNRGRKLLDEETIEIEFECNDDEFENLLLRLKQVFSEEELKTTL